jgi:hypothetical protein
MAVYFFHLCNDHNVLLDREGRELEGEQAIAALALIEARAIIGDDALHGQIDLTQHLDVEDAKRNVVYRLDFRDAVALTLPGER